MYPKVIETLTATTDGTWGGLMVTGTFRGDLSTEMSERQITTIVKSCWLELTQGNHYQEILLRNDTLTLTDGVADFSIYELSTGTKDQWYGHRFLLSLESKRSILFNLHR